MKTANVLTTKRQANIGHATLKTANVNPAMFPAKRIATTPENRLSVQGFELREWLEHLTGSNGLYFLDMSNMDSNGYSLHFKHHDTGKLMELDCNEEPEKSEGMLKALLFDLSLFSHEPILTFDGDHTENTLRKLSDIYFEHRLEIEDVIGRIVNVDLKNVFESGIYNDPRINELSIDGIYQAFCPGTSRTFKEQGSYGIYLIYLAIESIFHQIIGKRTMRLV